jgi:RIO kinase 1
MLTTLDGLTPIIQPFLDEGLVLELGPPIKSGKEATVFRCTAHPKTSRQQLALKVYRPRTQRSFTNDSIYREGSQIHRVGGGNTRAARALLAGSRFGRQVQSFTWCEHEWEVLCQLHEAGLAVPEPVRMHADAILMELFACEDGSVAPPLIHASFDSGSATELFHALCDDVEDMLALHVVHGDLSPYNVLWNGHEHRIIDFPQATDPRFNSSAEQLLVRDLQNLARFCERSCEVRDATEIAADMWLRFQQGEL